MELLEFLEQSPTAYQAVANIKDMLLSSGAVELSEKEAWQVEEDKTYFVIRNDSAIIAFHAPKGAKSFRVYAAHGDSPVFKIKENPEVVTENRYVKLNVEAYGGMIMSTWLDKPLTVAGRVIVKEGDAFKTRPVFLKDLTLVIPNVAVHMNREINDGFKYNVQTDLMPLYGDIEAKGTFMEKVAENAGVLEEDILGHDLYLVPKEQPFFWGPENEYFSSPRIDDLECAFTGAKGFMEAEKKAHICVLAIFDNEEVGSGTRQGAASTFLPDTLIRLKEALGLSDSDYRRYIAGSFLASADNGHAVHPNHPEKTDPTNRPVLNGGVLLKYAASQAYTTDGYAAAVFKDICKEAKVPFQIFFNRSDMRGGSTLGNISLRQVAFPSADIGLAQLSMHSSMETAGAKDIDHMVGFVKQLFS